MDMHGLSSHKKRKAACSKIGATPTAITCGKMVGAGYVSAIDHKDQCSTINTRFGRPAAEGLAYVGSMCCGGKKHNQICVPKVCEVDSDYNANAVTHYDCVRESVARDDCEARGGEHDEKGGTKEAWSRVYASCYRTNPQTQARACVCGR